MYRIEKNDWKSNNKKIKISESLRKMKMHVGYKKNSKDIICLLFQPANNDFFSEF